MSKKTLYIIIGILAAVLLAGLLCIALLPDSGNTPTDGSKESTGIQSTGDTQGGTEGAGGSTGGQEDNTTGGQEDNTTQDSTEESKKPDGETVGGNQGGNSTEGGKEKDPTDAPVKETDAPEETQGSTEAPTEEPTQPTKPSAPNYIVTPWG